MTSDRKPQRLSVVARDLNVGTSTIITFLEGKGYDIGGNPNAKIPLECLELLDEEFKDSKTLKEKAIKNSEKAKVNKETNITEEKIQEEEKADKAEKASVAPVDIPKTEPTEEVKVETVEEATPVEEVIVEEEKQAPVAKHVITPTKANQDGEEDGDGPKVLGTINLDQINQKTRPKRKSKAEKDAERKQKEDATKATKKSAKEKSDAKKEVSKKAEPKPAAKTEKVVEEPKAVDTPKPEKVENVKPIIKEKPVVKAETSASTSEFIETKVEKLTGPNVVGKIDINIYLKRQEESEKKKKIAKEERQKIREKEKEERKSKRKRIKKVKVDITKPTLPPSSNAGGGPRKKLNKKGSFNKPKKTEVTEVDVQKQIKETLARLTSPKHKSKTSKHRRDKREAGSQKRQVEFEKQELEKNILKVTEFVSVSELSTMMNVPVTNIIATCMSLGLFVSINQRLDAETMAILADEYGYEIEFVSAEVLNEIVEDVDDPDSLTPRPPIVTVMGHVDHGKTRLLDEIRHTNVIDGEAGGITQHIGAYSVTLDGGRIITFLDTPGHEAFTAMRARGAQITDVAIIVIAADDSIMPQTVEAINHASAAGVPIVFAINKIDKESANPDKIREALANMNYLVEEWGGKYQSQEISAKEGINIEDLLEKVLLESELLELTANADKKAVGTVIESQLDKGRGYVSTLLIQAGTLKIGDIILAGCQTGRVKAMYNERGNKIEVAGPSAPVSVLGLNGAPQAGDKFNILESDHEARNLANKRLQLQREQGLRTQKHITLDEIGRRLALGDFNEINIIVKGDVDGSVEALSDSLIKLSKDNFAVNIIHKAVGQISESDIMLAAASNAIIVGFQVRPSGHARKLAEKEEIEIRLYSIIYDAINEIKDAMEGMLSPTLKDSITGSAEIRDVFSITKVGTIAGCMVTDGKIHKKARVRIIRDGIVIYTGELGSLKRFKDDVKDVSSGYECGLNIDKFNDIKIGDIVEAFEEVEVKQKL